jgi:hypothetical protein
MSIRAVNNARSIESYFTMDHPRRELTLGHNVSTLLGLSPDKSGHGRVGFIPRTGGPSGRRLADLIIYILLWKDWYVSSRISWDGRLRYWQGNGTSTTTINTGFEY